jgi:hypothetical protein
MPQPEDSSGPQTRISGEGILCSNFFHHRREEIGIPVVIPERNLPHESWYISSVKVTVVMPGSFQEMPESSEMRPGFSGLGFDPDSFLTPAIREVDDIPGILYAIGIDEQDIAPDACWYLQCVDQIVSGEGQPLCGDLPVV